MIATGAIRFEGTTKNMHPSRYPAVPDFDVTAALKEASEELGYRHHLGVVSAKDNFYGQHSPDSMPVADGLNSNGRPGLHAVPLPPDGVRCPLHRRQRPQSPHQVP